MEPAPSDVTPWIERLKGGDDAALQPLWQRYYTAIARYADGRLPPRADVDSEALAASAFKSFWRCAKTGKFPQLNDRHDLWRLLIAITEQKIVDALRKRSAQKRGGDQTNLGDAPLTELAAAEPTPEFVLAMIEELEALLKLLPDDTLRQIAVWKMEGETNQEIARRLDCALRTVANKLDLIRAIFKRRNGSGENS